MTLNDARQNLRGRHVQHAAEVMVLLTDELAIADPENHSTCVVIVGGKRDDVPIDRLLENDLLPAAEFTELLQTIANGCRFLEPHVFGKKSHLGLEHALQAARLAAENLPHLIDHLEISDLRDEPFAR